MEITNELLAAYAEGNVTPEERSAIREYLTEHPSQLESVMMMMDEDDICIGDVKHMYGDSRHGIDYIIPKDMYKDKVGVISNAVDEDIVKPRRKTFGKIMDGLLDEIDQI